MRRLLLFIVFMSVSTGLMYLLVVSPPVSTEVEIPDLTQETNVLRLGEVVIRHQEGGRIAWRLWADKAVVNEKRQTADLTQVRFEVYKEEPGREQEVALHGRSEQGFFSQRPRRVILERKVRMVKVDGAELTSERLIYEDSKGTVTSPGAFEMLTIDAENVRGASFVYHLPE